MRAIANPLSLGTLILCLLGLAAPQVRALEPIQLTPPDLSHSKPLLQVLQERQSTKTYDTRSIPVDTLSNLLWAAFGINRPEAGKRTVATAVNCQDIDIYVVFAQGVYVYQAREHRLVPVLDRDVRSLAATQDYAQKAAIQLVYVSDYGKMNDSFGAKKPIYSAFHAGAISQNVYLYCASAGLGSVVRDSVDREALHKALKLRDNQTIVMGQTVGYAQAQAVTPEP
ncbi:MAG: SagB/ThcOx family dehydrogenase [Phycisphaerae bacterium]|nr:SagB/ThcOx family dehydrogenase [Phycisphaerae bacterium]